ncbi:PA4642 family protein [Agarilytica rhodophyticola]|uniref:PA4642 family protein n=1 Tax=Agarilytica rhodophyticola TaxID=1737490 RepID=UPI000B344EB6|nr:PA4642 family protein [Agarilytica rhodophyticola]
MTQKKDKQKVLGEVFTDERVREFLEVVPVGETDPHFTALERAYRGMKADNFATFVKFFVAEGKDINCTNANGETFLQVISKHRHSGPYITALTASGAR